MILTGLASEEQQLFDQVLENNVDSLLLQLMHSENSTEQAKETLNHINAIIGAMSSTWNAEHDMQGKLVSGTETVSCDTIQAFYSNLHPLFEVIRSRLPILRSEKKVAVGTLVNVHTVSEVLELALREKGCLTYYWGVSLTTEQIQSKQELSPATSFVLSCMGVNSEFNCFEELIKLRAAFPEVQIIVGGAAFPMFLVLKEDQNHPALTEPYKSNSFYYDEICKASSLKEFVSNVFHVTYCESVEDILQELDY